MIATSPADHRNLLEKTYSADLIVVGGGLAGLTTAVTAARCGISVILVQDRPMLGGNASSEIRLWILGATSHLGNNNRWAREGGLVDEILIENAYRNPEGNPVILDTILLEKAISEPNLTLLLNTAVYEVHKESFDKIRSVRAFCSQNSTQYLLQAPLFCDASGDGIVGFLAGAVFRMGAEARDEFDEQFAPQQASNELLGHSLYFYTRDVGRPVQFVPPSFALDDITRLPRWRAFNAHEHGCQLWWIEFGGRLDTVHETETIKWELWKIVYGVWNHIKNSGQFPESETLTLDWVGQIPGKRESRRFEGDYILSQRDLVEQRHHADGIAYGGWAIDLHPADGVYSALPGCQQFHNKGLYQIPYRCFYSRNISNLFLAGRIISATHIAFGSSRVMATCALGGQAVGVAAAYCRELQALPRDLIEQEKIQELQRRLLRIGHHIPGIQIHDPQDLATSALVVASSELELDELPPSQEWTDLSIPRAILFPVASGEMPTLELRTRVTQTTTLRAELRICSRSESFTPDVVVARSDLVLQPASLTITGARLSAANHLQTSQPTSELIEEVPFELTEICFDTSFDQETYIMVCLFGSADVQLQLSDQRVSGILTLSHRANSKVAEAAVQSPPPDSGLDTFDFWLPERRPQGKNFAMSLNPPLNVFSPNNVTFGPERPTQSANCWVARMDDEMPWLELRWPLRVSISTIVVCLDNDFDHPLESVLMPNPERRMPFCVPAFSIYDDMDNLVGKIEDNHLSRVTLTLPAEIETSFLRFHLNRNPSGTPVAIFRVRVFGSN